MGTWRWPAIVFVAAVLVAACAQPAATVHDGPSQMPSATPAVTSAPPTIPAPTVASGVRGTVTAGPTCPVQMPNESACADRPIAGAVLIALQGTNEAARSSSGKDGSYSLALPPGTYTIEPQPVAGILGTARPATVTVSDGAFATENFVYDTGIR